VTDPADATTAAGPGEGAAPPAATGYTLVLPPGWYHVPVRRGTDKAIKTITGRVVAEFASSQPRDTLTSYRIELERRLRAAADDARRKAATDLYLPLGLVRGMPVPASFLVSELYLGSVEDIDPALIVSHLASADGDSRPVTVAGAIGVRTERTASPDPAKKVEYPSRRVDYVLAVPGDRDRYLAVAFSTLGGGNPDDAYATLLVELFDAMMSTWRWSRE
jgi:hypothetical protein